MKTKSFLVCMIFSLFTLSLIGQETKMAYTPQGVRFLENKSYDNSDAARQEIVDLYKDLRLTDVLDGMDLIGLQDIGLMHNDIRTLWRDVDEFSHRILGFAVTVRMVPADVRVGQNSFDNTDEAKEWKKEQYAR
ncbi:MAG: hypothetical protein V3V53_09460, partial [Bacteroidales bacterium]